MKPTVFLSDKDIFCSDRCSAVDEAAQRGDIIMKGFVNQNYPGTLLPDGVLPQVCNLGYWNVVKKQNWGLQWHRNEGLEITFVSRGNLDFSVDNIDYKLKAGDLTLTRPWQKHRIGRPYIYPSRLYWLILDLGVRRPNDNWRWPDWAVFSPEDLHHLTELLQHNEDPVLKGNKEIETCFRRIAKVIDENNPHKGQNRLKVLINELFVLLLEVLIQAKRPLDSNLSSASRTVDYFLNELPKYISYDWTLEEMARECGLKRSRFSHYCKKLKNTSPLDILLQIRIDQACELLSNSDIPIQEIAKRCGFSTAQYFSKKFCQAKKLSPREFRTNQKSSHDHAPSSDHA